MQSERWVDDGFLDRLATHGDELADATLQRLDGAGQEGAVSRAFALLRANGDPLPKDAPPAFVEFFAETHRLGPDVDLLRLRRGERVYLRHALTASLVLLARSLPAGYAAPNLTAVLSISGDLGHHPYRRLLGVLQLLVDISSVRGFEDGGSAVISAQKMRLLHAGVRRIVARKLPTFAAQHGVAVNLEDMLATLMGFSYLVVDGLRTLGVGLREEEAEDLYYVWRVFARLVGIHPVGQPHSFEFIPADLKECAAFYQSYARRHFVPARDNPQGVALARENLRMMQDLLSRHGRWPGLGSLCQPYMLRLLGPDAAARVGLDTRPASLCGRVVEGLVPPLLQGLMDLLPGHSAERLSQLMFQGLIAHEYGHAVEFLVPKEVADLRKLA